MDSTQTHWLSTHNLPEMTREERGYAMLTFVLRPADIPLETVCELVTRLVMEPAEA